jgi:hypothetical protein
VVVLEKRTGFVRSRGIPDKRLECSHQLLPGQIYNGSHLDYSRSEEKTLFFVFFSLSSKPRTKQAEPNSHSKNRWPPVVDLHTNLHKGGVEKEPLLATELAT